MYNNMHKNDTHKNMEYPIFHTQAHAQKAPKVIKVVSLKRFLPEVHLELTPKSKISKSLTSPNVNNGSEKTIQSHPNENLENHAIDESNELEFHQTRILGNGSKIKFRNCTHSYEELSTLHECVHDTLVKVGDTFDSRDTFKQYLNENAKMWHYYYVCRNSKQKVIEYNCICMAYNIKKREVVIRKQKKRTTACPCKIRLTVDQTTNKLIVYYVCNHHDHPTTASTFHHYPHAKYLPQHVKEEFLDLTYLGLEVDLIQKYIHTAVGLTIKKKDIWSYAYRFKRKIFKRSISQERQRYIECLISKIRETYGGSLDNKQIELQSTPALDTLTLNYSGDIKGVLNDSATDTEVIVQYINEAGILCDENGAPVTNSSAIMQFINNYARLPDQDMHKTVFSDVIHRHPFDRESGNTVFESGPCAEELEGYNELDCAMNSEGTETVRSVSDGYEKRLSPTPDTPAVYAEMENFMKYYYVDHRYLPREDQESKGTKDLQDTVTQYSETESRVLPREEFIKAPPFVYHPSPIRHCSGHDHLTILTDVDAIFPGAKFLTHEVFLKYIIERAKRWFFYYSMAESGRTPENYVYKCVYGKTRVSKNAYRARGLRKRNKLTTQCPCQIRLRRLEADPTYLTVLYSCNHHDHDLNSRQFNAQPHSRRLPLVVKEEVKDLITLGVGADVLRNYVFAETGVRVYGKYFHNVRAAMRARGERRQYGEERLGALTKKIRDLEAKYGSVAKGNSQGNLVQIEAKNWEQPAKQPIRTEDRFTQAGLDEPGMQTEEYCELSDRDDFAEEVCIAQADTLPMEDSATQSKLQTQL